MSTAAPVLRTPCIEWRGSRSGGYGHVKYGSKTHIVSRLAWEVWNNRVIPAGMCVLHSCDNPACFNVAHLSLGTHTDNMRDMANKGRGMQGTRSPRSKLSEVTVLCIRRDRADGMTQREAAKKYNIDHSQIARITSRKAWAHVK